MDIEKKEQELEAYKKEVDKRDVRLISTYVIMMLILLVLGILSTECLKDRWHDIGMMISVLSILLVTGWFVSHD